MNIQKICELIIQGQMTIENAAEILNMTTDEFTQKYKDVITACTKEYEDGKNARKNQIKEKYNLTDFIENENSVDSTGSISVIKSNDSYALIITYEDDYRKSKSENKFNLDCISIKLIPDEFYMSELEKNETTLPYIKLKETEDIESIFEPSCMQIMDSSKNSRMFMFGLKYPSSILPREEQEEILEILFEMILPHIKAIFPENAEYTTSHPLH